MGGVGQTPSPKGRVQMDLRGLVRKPEGLSWVDQSPGQGGLRKKTGGMQKGTRVEVTGKGQRGLHGEHGAGAV